MNWNRVIKIHTIIPLAPLESTEHSCWEVIIEHSSIDFQCAQIFIVNWLNTQFIGAKVAKAEWLGLSINLYVQN